MENRIPPPVLALLTLFLIWLTARFIPWPQFQALWSRVLAMVLVAAGLLLDFSSLRLFRRARTTVNPLKPERASTLITDGAYRLSRNPMYLGLTLIMTGFTLTQGSLWGFVPLGLFIWYMTRFQIVPEERAMEKLFGQEYADYKARVRRWI